MTDPDLVPRVSRLEDRATGVREDVRALSYTLDELQETVDGHTVELGEIRRTVDDVRRTVDDVRRTVDDVRSTVDGHTEQLDRHTDLLTEILRRLPPAA